MKIRFYLLILGVVLMFQSSSYGGGSVSREDVAGIIQSNQKLASLLSGPIQISEIGTAVRLGRHFGSLGGARIGPYEFEARGPLDAEGTHSLIVSLITKVWLEDSDGNRITGPDGEELPIPDESMGEVVIKEELLSIEVRAAE